MLRISKKVNGKTSHFMCEYDKIVLELDANGNQTALDAVGLVPIIGVIKFGDEAAVIIKQGDNMLAVKGVGKTPRLTVEVNNGVKTINGKPVKINPGQQDKHIPGTNNYKQEIVNGKPRSILNENPNQLLDDYAGTGQKINDYKERIDFGKTIGQYYDEATRTYTDTSIGIVTYGNKGAHIIPARPK